jgi:hypothetical protein
MSLQLCFQAVALMISFCQLARLGQDSESDGRFFKVEGKIPVPELAYVVTDDAGGNPQQWAFYPHAGDNVSSVLTQSPLAELLSREDLRIYVARADMGQTMPNVLGVDWHGIVTSCNLDTDYEIRGGDRIMVVPAPICSHATCAKVAAPIERLFGISGASVLRDFATRIGNFFHLNSAYSHSSTAATYVVQPR